MAWLLSAVLAGPAGAGALTADDFVGVWSGPTLHDLAGGDWTQGSCLVDWEFRADHILVVDRMASFGYSWATGSWDVWYDEETRQDRLQIVLLGMNGFHPGTGGDVFHLLFKAAPAGDARIGMLLIGYAENGVETPLDDGVLVNLCDRRKGPPPPLH
ncbi:MAG: hypothetical protein R3F55_06650 [Alphaproteobacteria bacterium]